MPLLDRANAEKPLKPAERAEQKILEAILDGSYGPGDALPAERVLAQTIGVTRPTVRETLQRLAGEGWVTIAHGRSTRVNDYLATGGLGVLSTLVRYKDSLSHEMILCLLQARVLMLPSVAGLAVEMDAPAIRAYLGGHINANAPAQDFSCFDMGLQNLMVTLIRNPVVFMIFNDFSPVYKIMGPRYFCLPEAKQRSLTYYKALADCLDNDLDVKCLVEKEMQAAVDIWQMVPEKTGDRT